MGKLILIFLLFCSVMILGCSAYLNYMLQKEVISGRQEVVFKIPKGASRNEIANILKANNINVTQLHFKIAVKWLKVGDKLHYGKFKILANQKYTLQQLVLFLTEKGVQDINLTIPEGFNLRQISKEVQKQFGIEAVDFLNEARNQKLLDKYKIDAQSFEGYLYPETYSFEEEVSATKIIETMHKTFLKKIAPLRREISASNFSLHQIMTLASIVQGEVRVLAEAVDISALYQNRLKKRMLLQADPTIQYCLDEPRRLYKKDLELDNKYNTYKYIGLPPGPINNPSVKMVEAVLRPSKSEYLYMVAKGNGEHYFNLSLDDHLADKSKFDRVRRNVAREKGNRN